MINKKEKIKKINKSPLADEMRPQNIEDFFGQDKLLGEKSFLREIIEKDQLFSMIFWGPPGSGKTTLAFIIAKKTNSDFIQLSAVASGKKNLLEVFEKAKQNQKEGRKTVLFVDEIHRWNKAQQDALLPNVEKGLITLIGATTENPSFEVNSALLSRARVFVFRKIERKNIEKILEKAVSRLNKEGLGIKIKKDAVAMMAGFSNGDARMALNTLEACVGKNQKIDCDLVREVLQKSHLLYDKNGQEHYNIISALHKSMRGGDADASVYWLARMLEGGEDPIYIARRLVRFASEDIGLADNHALILANAVFDACHKLGMPECSVHLTQAVIYLSKTKKSILAYEAYGHAKKDVEKFGNLDVPMSIRNAPTKLMKNLGYGKNYKYTPKEDSSGQEYLPEELKGRRYL